MASTIQPGTILQGTYQVKEQIGAGGGGTIFKGVHMHLQNEIAIKKIHDKGNYDKDEVFREAQILTKLRHSYLPRVYDFLLLDSGVYTVMDFIPGQSLEQMIKGGHKFSEKEVVRYGTQLAEVLTYLHSQTPAIIHGDIKPANIMVTPENNICLIDFNISGMADENGNAYVMGYSDGYAAPEQYSEFLGIKKQLDDAKAVWMQQYQFASTPQNNVQWPFPNVPREPNITANVNDPNATVMMDDPNATVLMNDPNATVLMENAFDPNATVLMGNAFDPNATVTMDAQSVFSQPTQPQPAVNVPPMPTMQSLGIKGIHITPRSDVYSVGATLYHMLAGVPLSKDSSKNPTLKISDGLVVVLNKMLASNPTERYKDARELLNALNGIYRLDKRYKRVVFAQQLLQSIFILMIGAGIVCAVYGVRLSKTEATAAYFSRVDAIATEGEEAFVDAINIDDTRSDAYIEMASYIFNTRNYATTADFIENTVLTHPAFVEGQSLDYAYYLLGRSYYELDDKSEAAFAFKNAVNMNPSISDYRIFYALTLADQGKADEAKNQLNTAVSMGADEGYVLLLNGEIAKTQGMPEEAENYFMECVKSTSDDYVKSRAYIFCSDLYKDATDKSEDTIRKQIQILEEANKNLPNEYRTLVLSRLAQACMNLYDFTGDYADADKAIDAYQQILKVGVGDFTVYNNIVVLYEQSGRYDEAIGVLDSVENLYGNYYGFYKRKAFLEFRIQNSKADGRDMNFDKFEEYYEKAKSLYADMLSQNDTEMLYLEQTYANYLSIK